jgi:hypothetical protein
MAEHLNETVTHAATLHDRSDLGRLLGGLNLLTAHLAHITQRLAQPAAADAPPQAAATVADALTQAAGNYALAAGHLKHAQQKLHPL